MLKMVCFTFPPAERGSEKMKTAILGEGNLTVKSPVCHSKDAETLSDSSSNIFEPW